MNKNKIIFYVLTLLIITGFTTSNYWIPKFRPFGTSTTFTDSTNYVTLNKGFYTFDSIKTDRDLIVRGAVVLDTNRLGKIQYRDYDIFLTSNKTGGNMVSQLMDDGAGSAGDFLWMFGNYLTGITAMTLDSTTGLNVNRGNIFLSGGTQQIKLPSDTASDYDGNNSITLNRQSGRILTKSLTTAALGDYTLTLVNSLISANTIVICQPTKGSLTTGTALIRAAVSNSGSATILIYNASSSAAFNGTVGFNYVLFN